MVDVSQPDVDSRAVIVAEGYLVHLRDTQSRLSGLGATMEFRPEGARHVD